MSTHHKQILKNNLHKMNDSVDEKNIKKITDKNLRIDHRLHIAGQEVTIIFVISILKLVCYDLSSLFFSS